MRWGVLAWVALLPWGGATMAESSTRPDPVELSRSFDELYRSDSSRGLVAMTVTTPSYSRTLEMAILTRGQEDTLVRIESPKKERGVATLKKGPEMWNYLPKIKKTIRIPPTMMMGSWMGSDFTNDDLVHASSWEKDYTIAYADQDAKEGEVCLAYTPKPDAPVTWSRVVGCFDSSAKLPKRFDFFDDKARLARTMTYDSVGELGGRTMPRRMTLQPLSEDKRGNRTVLEFRTLEFGVPVQPDDFSLTALQRER